MSEIRAFVGHSFAESNEAVVRKFLKYFDESEKALPNFSWESAENAEPKLLTEKVLRIIANKNVLIAICTRKELAIDPNELTPLITRPGFQKGKREQFSAKTSDWIIQEIGLAKGRDMQLIILLEKDVHVPGGLQGDVEHIPFERDAPEKSFPKIVAMLASISPKLPSGAVTSSDAASEDKKEEQDELSTDVDWRTLSAKWPEILQTNSCSGEIIPPRTFPQI